MALGLLLCASSFRLSLWNVYTLDLDFAPYRTSGFVLRAKCSGFIYISHPGGPLRVLPNRGSHLKPQLNSMAFSTIPFRSLKICLNQLVRAPLLTNFVADFRRVRTRGFPDRLSFRGSAQPIRLVTHRAVCWSESPFYEFQIPPVDYEKFLPYILTILE